MRRYLKRLWCAFLNRKCNPKCECCQMALSKANKSKVKKVVKGLNKASRLHAGQAKTLKGIMKNGSRKISKKS